MTSPSQTVGPFFAFALPYDGGPVLAPEWHPDAVTVRGRVLDGAGEPLPDALVEIWQTDSQGEIPTARSALDRSQGGFSGFGRCPTDRDGGYYFSTVRPGGDSPYLAMLVFARGLLKPVATRVYFQDDESDPFLGGLDPERRSTLIAESVGGNTYRFDVHLQGDRETVFLAF